MMRLLSRFFQGCGILAFLCVGSMCALAAVGSQIKPTPTITLTPTKTFTPTVTLTPSITYTPSITFTPSQTYTPSATFTSTLTYTPSETLTVTKTPNLTQTAQAINASSTAFTRNYLNTVGAPTLKPISSSGGSQATRRPVATALKIVLPTSAPAQPTTASNGPTALCKDGTYSYAANHRGACSHHGGVQTWYK